MKYKNKDILFLDIETVGSTANYKDLNPELQELWTIKALQLNRGELEDSEIATSFEKRSAIYSEFGKIVCISVGLLVLGEDNRTSIRVKSFAGDEIELLEGFSALLNSHFDAPNSKALCGHNIKEFDIPYICRRLIINGMQIPRILDIGGKKPWQVEHLIDTLVLWRFGDYKHYTSLRLLSAVLGIPSPKDDIDGSMVHQVYWVENGIDRIVTYCEKDVITTIKVFLKLTSSDLDIVHEDL